MNEIDRVHKLLAATKAGEKGWRKTLDTAEGSHSRTLAEKNLVRLSALRKMLIEQLDAMDLPQRREVETAKGHSEFSAEPSGNVTPHRLGQS